MTAAATPATVAAPLTPAAGWLFGRWRDLLFGCGLAYAAVFLGLVVVGRELRVQQPDLLFPLAFLAVSIPHYGATLLRVYERARDRRAYALFSIWITLALAAAFVGALFLPAVGTLLVTLYFTWSPWHYTGQNYGLAVMFLRRRGVSTLGSEKRWLYASFVLSFLLVAVVSHSAGVGVRASEAYGGGDAIRFAPLGIPASLVSALAPALCAAQLGALGVALALLARRTTVRALTPVFALWLAQALWFTLPYACLQFGWLQRLDVLDWRNNNHYFMWIALAHAAQYMWVTAYFARQSGAQKSVPAFWLKAMAAGALVWTLPLVLFWKPGFGVLSPDQGMLVLVAAIANLHHFVLDGAIWKLRGPIARVLIQSQTEESEAPMARRAWLGRAAWALCGAALVAYLAGVLLEDAWARALRERDLFAARAALGDLFWVGRDRASYHLAVARGMLQVGAHDAALAEARKAAHESQSVEPHVVLAQASLALGRPEEAARAFEAASALAPERVGLRRQAARAWRAAGRGELALAQLEAAARLAPADASLARELARARDAALAASSAAP